MFIILCLQILVIIQRKNNMTNNGEKGLLKTEFLGNIR